MRRNDIPKVLLLGNGINRAFENKSWNELLKSICADEEMRKTLDTNGRCEKCNRYIGCFADCPEPMKAILVSRDSLDDKLKAYNKELYGKIGEQQAKLLQKLLEIGFDEILTTNYSYELELAALNIINENITDYYLIKMMNHTEKVKRCESMYLMHTYNCAVYKGIKNRIWHIHGEARKPGSMILGHYYYANLISCLREISKERGNSFRDFQREGKDIKYNSWFDAFIMGDIYIIGLGYALSELDLWWLINRKKRENANHGKIHFYEFIEQDQDRYNAKYRLLEIMGCDLHLEVRKDDWVTSYQKLIDSIKY